MPKKPSGGTYFIEFSTEGPWKYGTACPRRKKDWARRAECRHVPTASGNLVAGIRIGSWYGRRAAAYFDPSFFSLLESHFNILMLQLTEDRPSVIFQQLTWGEGGHGPHVLGWDII